MKNKYVQAALITVFLFFTACGVVKGCSKSETMDEMIKTMSNNYQDDCIAEEFLEDMIEDTTGLILDISPASPEEEKEEEQCFTQRFPQLEQKYSNKKKMN